jgi:Ca2+-binding EF-hand superfamily protein
MQRITLIYVGIVLLCITNLQADDKNNKKEQGKVPPAFVRLLSLTPEQFIKRFDKNGDGFLTKDELPPRLAAIFDRADQNGDGKLDSEEVAQMLQVLRQRLNPAAKKTGKPASSPEVAQRVDQIFARLDTNKDGKISREEAKGPLAEHFDLLDLNKDRFLDKEEVRRAVERLVARQAGDSVKRMGTEKPFAAQLRIPDFDGFDLDADGRLSREELNKTPFGGRFDEMDTNKDGTVDRKEFEGFFKREAEKKAREETKEKK